MDAANACGLQNQGTMIAAASEALWNNGAACGRMYRITCTAGTNSGVAQPCKAGTSVTVKIVDLCPSPGCQGTFDLSQEAFSAIADPNEGKIEIDYTQSVSLHLHLLFSFSGYGNKKQKIEAKMQMTSPNLRALQFILLTLKLGNRFSKLSILCIIIFLLTILSETYRSLVMYRLINVKLKKIKIKLS